MLMQTSKTFTNTLKVLSILMLTKLLDGIMKADSV